MLGIDDLLAQVESLISSVKPVEAEDRLRSLLETMGTAELRVWEPDLRVTINKFLPKRRRALSALLDGLLVARESQGEDQQEEGAIAEVDMDAVLQDLETDLIELSEHHIFQWSTFYRDYLGVFFARFIESSSSPDIKKASGAVRILLRNHTKETFTKGYFFVTRFDTAQHAVGKSLGGLQRFLDLPVEFYSARLSADLSWADSIGLRHLTSSMLCGILEGYAGLRFEKVTGAELLSQYARSWAHVLTFMTAEHVRASLNLIDASEFRHGAKASILPLASALDKLIADATGYSPLPALSQLVWPQRRLDVSLRPPPFAPDRRPVAVQCYLDPDLVAADLLTEAANREVGAVVAPLRPDLRAVLVGDERLTQIVVPVLEDVAETDPTKAHLIRCPFRGLQGDCAARHAVASA